MKSLVLTLVTIGILSGCGQQGEKGDAGPKGDSGGTGATGTTASISSSTHCAKTVSSLNFEYDYVVFSSGDVWVNCNIEDSSAEYSNSSFYKSTQTGASTGGCLLTYDIDTASSGYWSFTTSPSRQAIYKDTGSANNGTTVSFATSDCSTN